MALATFGTNAILMKIVVCTLCAGKSQCWCDSIERLYDEFDLERFGWAGDGWYFWNDNRNICYGPYSSEETAKRQFLKHLKLLDNEHSDNRSDQ